jgi:hypothetical protein
MGISKTNVLFDEIIDFTLLVGKSLTEIKNRSENRKNICRLLGRTIRTIQIKSR